MDQVMSSLLVIAITVYGILLMIGGVTGNPWKFANRPYQWLFLTTCNMLRRFFRTTGRTLQNGLRHSLRHLWKGLSTFWRNYPRLSGIMLGVVLSIIVVILTMIYTDIIF